MWPSAGSSRNYEGYKNMRRCIILFCLVAPQPKTGLARLIVGASRSHSDTSHSVGLLWIRDRPLQRPLPHKTQCSQETDTHFGHHMWPSAGSSRNYKGYKKYAKMYHTFLSCGATVQIGPSPPHC